MGPFYFTTLGYYRIEKVYSSGSSKTDFEFPLKINIDFEKQIVSKIGLRPLLDLLGLKPIPLESFPLHFYKLKHVQITVI